ncbi:MAG TPA: hypothetical protein VN088_07160 [Nocardioides sp.]|nr:hypothetical protein [Nocardioides sp.]
MRTQLRAKARRTRDRWIDQVLLRVERARKELAAGDVDILVLGDSSCLSWAYHDTDRSTIPQLVAQRTGLKVVTIAAGGFSAPVYASVLRILDELPQRPRAVMTTACIRTNAFAHVRRHPIHGHNRSIAALEKVRPGRPIRAFGVAGSTWKQDELAAFRALSMTTRWGGTKTIGDHLRGIEGKGEPPWPVEVERGRFDYFNGEVLTDDNPELRALETYGARLAAYGVPVAAYWVPPPLEHGERILPGFSDHVLGNLAVMEKALDLPGRGLPELIHPVLEETDFQDARNGVEHFAFSGRSTIADALLATLAPALG